MLGASRGGGLDALRYSAPCAFVRKSICSRGGSVEKFAFTSHSFIVGRMSSFVYSNCGIIDERF